MMKHQTLLPLLLPLLVATCMAPAAESPLTQPSDEKDAFQSKTNWKGREINPKGKNAKGSPVSAKVIKREGNKVTFNYWTASDEGRKGVQLEGTVDKGQIRARVTKLLPGDAWHE